MKFSIHFLVTLHFNNQRRFIILFSLVEGPDPHGHLDLFRHSRKATALSANLYNKSDYLIQYKFLAASTPLDNFSANKYYAFGCENLYAF